MQEAFRRLKNEKDTAMRNDKARATSSLFHFIEHVGDVEFQVYKQMMDRSDFGNKLSTLDGEVRRLKGEMDKRVVAVRGRVDDLGKLLSRLPGLLDKVDKDNQRTVANVASRVKEVEELTRIRAFPHGHHVPISSRLRAREAALVNMLRRRSSPGSGVERDAIDDVGNLLSTETGVKPAAGRAQAAAAAAAAANAHLSPCRRPDFSPSLDLTTYHGLMRAGEIWLDREHFAEATLCFKQGEAITKAEGRRLHNLNAR